MTNWSLEPLKIFFNGSHGKNEQKSVKNEQKKKKENVSVKNKQKRVFVRFALPYS
jgi:hypothetical protein